MKIYKSLITIALSVGLTQAVYGSPWPSATPDNVTAQSGQRTYIRVLANDRGENLSINEVNARTVGLGTVQMNAHRKALFYTSPRGFTGNDSFWYAIKDSRGRTNSTQVFVNVIPAAPKQRVQSRPKPQNKARTNTRARVNTQANTNQRNNNPSRGYSGFPSANEDVVTTSKNTPITVAVLENDRGDRLRLSSVNDWTVKGGRAAIQGNSIEYRPKADFVGQDSFWYNFEDAKGRANSTQVKITVTDRTSNYNDGGDNTVTVVESANMAADAVHINMHTGFLKKQNFVWGEPKGTRSMKITQAASAGSIQLQVAGGLKLMNNQLISYRATNGDYYTIPISQSQGNTIQLKTALPAPVAEGSNVWNFYHDGAHPNRIGFFSLVDYALRNNDGASLNAGKHVMLGDSWFENSGVQERLAEKLNNAQIINKGVGGNTAASLLGRFDRDVASQKPDVVWLMAGTNDYYQGVSVATYAANMQTLIEKINGIGAKAMVFDSSVAPSMSGSNAMTEKSHEYARVLANLLKRGS